MPRAWTRAVGMEKKEQIQEMFRKGDLTGIYDSLFMEETDKEYQIFNWNCLLFF